MLLLELFRRLFYRLSMGRPAQNAFCSFIIVVVVCINRNPILLCIHGLIGQTCRKIGKQKESAESGEKNPVPRTEFLNVPSAMEL